MAWTILHVLPLIHFAIAFILLGIFDISFSPTPLGVINILVICFLSFSEFGYYRIY